MKPWFKFYGGEYLSDPKMLTLSAGERSCWITLLCYASVSNIPGELECVKEERIMTMAGLDITREEWRETLGVFKKFEDLGMIEIKNEMITIKNFRKRQGDALTNYERVKKYREKKKYDNEMITHDNGHDNKSNGIDIEVEERRRDKNKIKRERERPEFFSNKEKQEEVIKTLSKKTDEAKARQEVKNFIDYWTEKSASGLERWEMQTVFEPKKRFNRWLERSKLFSEVKKPDYFKEVGNLKFKTKEEVDQAEKDGLIYWDRKANKWFPVS